MIPDELKDAPWTPERALATLEAYLAGGDELGDVSEIEAETAIYTLRSLLEVLSELRTIAPKAKAEQIEVQEKLATLRADLAAVTAERDALQARTTWQPVSQALPSRGTEQVLAVLKSGRTREVVRARYIHQYEVPDAWYDGECEYNEENGKDYTPRGWYVFNEVDGVHAGPIEFDTITHWMPMPALPEKVTK